MAVTAASCGRPAPSIEPETTASVPPPAPVAVAIAAGPISCGPNFGGCWLRVVVWPGPDQTANAFVSAELPIDVFRFQVRARSVPVPLAVTTAGRHAVEVQIAYGTDVGTPPPANAPKSWTPLCADVVELVAGEPWTIPIRFRGEDGCTIAATRG